MKILLFVLDKSKKIIYNIFIAVIYLIIAFISMFFKCFFEK